MQPISKSIQVSKSSLQTLVWGDQGEPIVLLHGFPETPHIYQALAIILVSKGYQVYAPFLPGYGNSSPSNHDCSITYLEDLADVLGAFLLKLSDGKRGLKLIGHDWGAVGAYATAAKYPHRVSRIITMGVPPLPLFLKSFINHPSQWLRSSYMLFFQLRARIPEITSSKFNHLLLRKLCNSWSGESTRSPDFFSSQDFTLLNGLTHPLGYYRGLLPGIEGNLRKWLSSYQLAFLKLKVPTTILVGETDHCIPPQTYQGFEHCIDAPSSLTIVKGAGHFLPIDNPEMIASKI